MRSSTETYHEVAERCSAYEKTCHCNSMTNKADEYGVCVGLISMEDLIEEIIGDIKDEYDDAEHNNIVKIDDTHYSIDGSF